MPLRQLTRLLAAAVLVSGAAPALAQTTAAITVTLQLDGNVDPDTGDPTPATAGFTLGSEETYSLTVKNTGDLIVTGFTVKDVTITTAGTGAVPVKGISITDCTPTGTGTSPPTFPCTWSGTLAAGKKAVLTIAATYPAPKPLDPGTAACPAGAIDVNASATVSDVMQDAATLIAGDVATVTATDKLRNWADLEVVSVDGPANAGQGQTYTYTAVVKNLGPCDAPNVRISWSPDGSMSYADGSATGCTNPANSLKGPPAGVGYRNNCEIGALAKDASHTVTAGFTLVNWPKDQTQGAASNAVSVVSRSVETSAGPPAVWSVGADDPNADNDTGSTSAPVDFSGNGGCSTGGAGGVLAGLVALAALRLGRRRARA